MKKHYLQTFHGIVANLVYEDEDHANAVIAQGHPSHNFVPYDPDKHAPVRWGDVHDLPSGTFATPPLSPEKRQQAYDVMDELMDKGQIKADQVAKISAGIDKAKTRHDLPDAVRADVRGYPDGHPEHAHKRARANLGL